MSAAWLVYTLVTGALIVLAAAALDAVARARRWPSRWIWAAAMLGLLALIAGSARPAEQAGLVRMSGPAIDAAGAEAATAGPTLARLLGELRSVVDSAMLGSVATVARWLPAWTGTVAFVLWLAAAIATLGVLLFVHLRLRRARREWPTADLHGRRVRVSPSVGPAIVGVVRPEIVVPQWLLERTAAEQRLVLAHEEEHVRARDHLLLAAACVVVSLMPWHPAAWWSLARLRLALELDCDARVLRGGVHARSYGEMLIDLAGQCSGFRVGATALADKTSHLERRLLAMRPITTRLSVVRTGAAFAAAGLLLLAACEARVPTSAEIDRMDVDGAVSAAQRTGMLDAAHGANANFYVNGVKVTAAEAHAITPNDIASIDVQKGTDAAAPADVRIVTVASAADGTRYRSAAPAGEVASPEPSKPRELHDKTMLSNHMFAGVIFIDGVRADAAGLHKLDPKSIVSVEVVKGAAAAQASSDPAARNGVIKVTTTGERSRQ